MQQRTVAKITVDIDGQWGSHNTPAEIERYLKERLTTALGFRGTIKKVTVTHVPVREG